VLSLLTLGLTAGAGVGAFASWIACLDAAEGAHARYTRRIHAGHVLVAVHGAPNQPGLMDRARRVLGRAGEAEHGDHENSDAR
jgi:hypothetical protein